MKNKLISLSKNKKFKFSLLVLLVFFITFIFAFNKINKVQDITLIPTEEDTKTTLVLDQKHPITQQVLFVSKNMNEIHFYSECDINSANIKVELFNTDTKQNLLNEDYKIENIQANSTVSILLNSNVAVNKQPVTIVLKSNTNSKDKSISLRANQDSQLSVGYKTNDLSLYTKAFLAISFILICFISLALYFYLFKGASTYKFYFACVLVLGIILSFMNPIGFTPDEAFHYNQTTHVSNMILGIKDDTNTCLLHMRACDHCSYWTNGTLVEATTQDRTVYENLLSQVKNIRATDTQVIESTRTYNNGANWYYYIFSSIGLTIGRVLSLNTILGFYLARFFNLLFFAFVSTYTIKRLSAYKSIFFFVGMLPIVLQQTCSLSYDSMIITFCFFVSGQIVNILNGCKLNTFEKVMLVISSIVLIHGKSHAYLSIPISLILAILYVHKDQFIKNKEKCKKCMLAIAMISIFAYALLLLCCHTSYSQDSVMYLILHPFYTLSVAASTAYGKGYELFTASLGNGLGLNMHVKLNDILVMGYVLLFFYLLLHRKEGNKQLTLSSKVLIVLPLFISIFGITAALYQWCLSTAFISQFTTDNVIIGLQGRYYVPMILIWMIALCRSGFYQETNNDYYINLTSCFGIILVIFNMFIMFA